MRKKKQNATPPPSKGTSGFENTLFATFAASAHAARRNRYPSLRLRENPGLMTTLLALKKYDPFLKKNIVYFFKKKFDARKKRLKKLEFTRDIIT